MGKKFLCCGNEAISECAVQAGCRHYYGYPITPQNEISAYLAKRMKQVNGTFIQAESEIAAINMALGTSACGKRTMTSSSGPGLSLKQECISYMAGCELPVVIVNVMRTGPGLGNISPAQGDYFQATRGGGHGDYRTIVLAPSCVQDAGDLTYDAFDLADKYRTPVMLLLDGMIGQMREPFELREYKQKENYDKSWALTGCKGRQQNIVRSFYMQWSDSQKLSQRLVDRYETIQRNETRAECFLTDDADLIVVAYGTPARMAKSAITKLRGQGVKVGLFRPITLWPYPEKELQRVAKHASDILVIEWSAGQMIEDVKLSLGNSNKIHFFGKIGGALTDADEIEQKIDEIFIKNGV